MKPEKRMQNDTTNKITAVGERDTQKVGRLKHVVIKMKVPLQGRLKTASTVSLFNL